MVVALADLASLHQRGGPKDITSDFSAHPAVPRAGLRRGRNSCATVLIEATCNQVNHLGGDTGMQSADFAAMVRDLAMRKGCPPNQVILGGDHLGPNPRRH